MKRTVTSTVKYEITSDEVSAALISALGLPTGGKFTTNVNLSACYQTAVCPEKLYYFVEESCDS